MLQNDKEYLLKQLIRTVLFNIQWLSYDVSAMGGMSNGYIDELKRRVSKILFSYNEREMQFDTALSLTENVIDNVSQFLDFEDKDNDYAHYQAPMELCRIMLNVLKKGVERK